MLITAFRSAPAEYSAPKSHPVLPVSPAGDAFIPAADEANLHQANALAALALAARSSNAKAALPEELATVVRAELGQTGFTSFDDERMRTLSGYLRDGWEGPFVDPLAILGQGWTEQQREPAAWSEPVVFLHQGETVSQQLAFDQKNGTTTLHTIHAESFISTRHYGIVENRDGKVVISDETVH